MQSHTSASIPAEIVPVRFGTITILPATGPGNATNEELTWPVLTAKPLGGSIRCDGPADSGNATAEERTWPVATASSPSPSVRLLPDEAGTS